MCLLALFYRVVDDAPLIVGANREEFYNRLAEPPQILEGPPRAVAGVDAEAGGTWLGVNQNGLFAAVTNRHKSRPTAQPRSRGLLVRELLGCRTTQEAVTLATRELDLDRYAGCNVILSDGGCLLVFQAGDWLRIKHLPPGLHLLTNHDVNDESDARLAHAWYWLERRSCKDGEDCLEALRTLCAQTGNGEPAICLHGSDRGTVSSTLVLLRESLEESAYLHADGSPDRTAYEDYSHLLKEIAE